MAVCENRALAGSLADEISWGLLSAPPMRIPVIYLAVAALAVAKSSGAISIGWPMVFLPLWAIWPALGGVAVALRLAAVFAPMEPSSEG